MEEKGVGGWISDALTAKDTEIRRVAFEVVLPFVDW